jgi:hypothetical protein
MSQNHRLLGDTVCSLQFKMQYDDLFCLIIILSKIMARNTALQSKYLAHTIHGYTVSVLLVSKVNSLKFMNIKMSEEDKLQHSSPWGLFHDSVSSQTIQHQILGQMNGEGCGRKQLWPEVLPGTCLEGLKKAMKNLSQDSTCPGQDSNQAQAALSLQC